MGPLRLALFFLLSASAAPQAPEPATNLENAFRLGWFVRDSNDDGIADMACGNIIVPASPSAAENACAANLAARLGFETTGLTLPVVVNTKDQPAACGDVPAKIWVGKDALPAVVSAQVAPLWASLANGEGGVFSAGGEVAVVALDPVGLLTAADAYAARAPYQWAVPGERIQTIAGAINTALKNHKLAAQAELVGVTYAAGQPGIRRAILRVSGTADPAELRKALSPEDGPPVRFAAVRELQFLLPDGSPFSVINAAPLAVAPLPAAPEGAADQFRSLDLAGLYTVKGLLSGSPKKPVPSAVAARLYIPEGAAGVALANLAARMGLETTGITLPVASPISGASASQVQTAAVLAGSSPLTSSVMDLLAAPAGVDLDKLGPAKAKSEAELPALQPGEGEIRVVQRAFGRNPAMLARGDERGSTAALHYASVRLPYLWEPGKQHESLEEIRYDLRRFFSLRSSAGQAAVALYHLDRWLKELSSAAPAKKIASVHAEVYVDDADPGLRAFIRKEIQSRLKVSRVEVRTGGLHAGLKCCDSDPSLHYESPLHPFQASPPTFSDNFTIPWEGKRLIEAVELAAKRIKRGEPVVLEARVSEGPEQREKLQARLTGLLVNAGADREHLQVKVLCAYKQGYSWLMDDVAPALAGQPVARVEIEFAPYQDPNRTSAMRSVSRWVQELYPVDEMLAKQLHLALHQVQFAKMKEMNSDAGPTYRVHAYAADGREILRREFKVATSTRDYSQVFPNYERVNVATGWIRLESGGHTLLDQRLVTDPEQFWDHYQTKTLPRIFQFIMEQNNGKPRVEYQPLFDTLKISVKMSEPDYDLGLDQERISSLEALQEDTLFSTQNFFYLLGNLESTGMMDYQGRVIPVVYPSRDGEDGEVSIEFYAKDAAHPLVRLAWKEAGQDQEHEKQRDLPALAMGDPRLVAVRVSADAPEVESLTWRMPADARQDQFQEWRKVAPEEQIERTMFPAEQAQGQLRWLEAMHGAGLYRDSLAFPRLKKMAFEFELPPALDAPEHTKAEIVTAEIAVPASAGKRPRIGDFSPAPVDAGGKFVSWEEPISPSENERLLARLAKYPGVNVYWMGRSYLGKNLWAADITLPSPSELRSYAKETTLKAALIYSGRQHANEVSSTSHIFKLAEQLVTDADTRAMLKKVNVVVHPITNPDGAQLAIDLAKITPKNMLHPGYHASLTADVSAGQWEEDPLYPESRTRRQLWEAWLPDAFLNPHGYPSHEWVQPFSEYAAWVITRNSAESGRAWWISRGWFTSLGYLRDEEHPHSKDVAYAIRDRIAEAMARAPGVLEMNQRMNDRYQRYGQRWDERHFQQPIYKGVRVYMALKGQAPGPRSPSFMARFPDVTYDDGYTEAPDETAHGAWLRLVASAGLAYDRVHLEYIARGKFKIKRTEREFFNGVNWKVDRDRPVLPK